LTSQRSLVLSIEHYQFIEAEMVGGNGLEPMTSAMSTQCSNQLS
jgi:hypothetical protein